MANTPEDTITIPLTGRRPVVIVKPEWPRIAAAEYHDFDGQHDFQSARHWKGYLRVRQHADGRAIVYAGCSRESQHEGERDHAERAGELVPAGGDIIAAIVRVHRSIDAADSERETMWRLLANECISDMPAEVL